MNIQNITSLEESCIEAMNITNFINIYMNIYIYIYIYTNIICDKIDSIN